MKLPDDGKLQILENKLKQEETVVKKLTKVEELSFMIHVPDLEDQKGTNNYIKKLVSTIRSSTEYRRYIQFLRKELDINKCSFLSNIDFDGKKKITLEFHHYPFSIFDITKIVYTDMVKNNKIMDSFSICDEVMKLHYEGLVGLVPLSLTAHQLAHSGSLFIPLDVPLGNVKAFIQRYNGTMSDDYKDMLRNLIMLTHQKSEDYSLISLDKQITLLDVEDFTPKRKVKLSEDETAIG